MMLGMDGKVLVTGGTGFIGSHAALALLEQGHEVVLFDNLCNSSREVAGQVMALAGRSLDFVEGDVREAGSLRAVFSKHRIAAVMHFAGLKSVADGQALPLEYYDNNVTGSAVLLAEMQRAGVRTLVFSSSATVYGEGRGAGGGFDESMPLAPVNVYGRSKRIVEDMVRDLNGTGEGWRYALLRYFNPVGAHPSGRIGEAPAGRPGNLFPFIAQVAAGLRPRLQVFGGDYPTPDGTGRRDYLHVQDLVAGHLAALRILASGGQSLVANLGTGRPHSVLEVVRAFERACGREIPCELVGRRPGDLAEYWADPSCARGILGWQAHLDLETMCADAWRWQVRLMGKAA